MRTVRGSEKTNFNMAEGNTDCQMSACEKFFPKEFQPLEDYVAEQLKGSGYDITRFDAYEVVELFSRIVNDLRQFVKGNIFRFLIREGGEIEVLFQLVANPKQHQPGNGFLSLRKWKKDEFFSGKSYDELCVALNDHYEKNTKSFASQIKKLFRNNEVVNEKGFPQVTFEAYMLLLFEIARRSVTSVENPTDRKKQLDDLPIGSAIAGLLKLLKLEICTFEDVFSRKDKFFCFEGEPGERREAINRMNETLHLHEPSKMNETLHLKELSKTFRSKERQVEELTEKVRRL